MRTIPLILTCQPCLALTGIHQTIVRHPHIEKFGIHFGVTHHLCNSLPVYQKMYLKQLSKHTSFNERGGTYLMTMPCLIRICLFYFWEVSPLFYHPDEKIEACPLTGIWTKWLLCKIYTYQKKRCCPSEQNMRFTAEEGAWTCRASQKRRSELGSVLPMTL